MVVGRPQPLHDAVCRRPCVDQPQVMTEGFGLSGPLLSSCLAEIKGEMLEAAVAVQLLQLLIRKRQEWFRQLQWAWWADGHRTKEQWLRGRSD